MKTREEKEKEALESIDRFANKVKEAFRVIEKRVDPETGKEYIALLCEGEDQGEPYSFWMNLRFKVDPGLIKKDVIFKELGGSPNWVVGMGQN